MRQHILLSAAAFMVTALGAAESLAYKGDPLGMSLASFRTKHDRLAKDTERAPFIYVDEDAAEYRAQKMIRASKAYPYEKKGPESFFGGINAYISFWFYAQSLADWEACAGPGRDYAAALKRALAPRDVRRRQWTPAEAEPFQRVRLGRITAHFPSKDFAAVVTALTAEYGTPVSKETRQFRSESGQLHIMQVIRWTRGEDSIEAREHFLNAGRAQVQFERSGVVSGAGTSGL